MKTLNGFLFYLFPLFVLLYQLFSDWAFLKSYWVLYGIGFALLIYAHYRHRRLEGDEGRSIDVRRFYFTYYFFLMILLYPGIDKLNLLQNKISIMGLSNSASVYLVSFLAALVIYFIIISDFSISEISIGNTKVTVLKEKYKAEISNHMDLTSILQEKISAESYVLQNMKKYCIGVWERLDSPDDEFVVTKEYQMVLNEYFEYHKADCIKMTVLDDLSTFGDKFYFRYGELSKLKYSMQKNEISSFEKKGTYYLFIPYAYRFEAPGQKTYIVLESEIPILIDAETRIIANILTVFTNELLNLSAVEINGN